MSSMIVPISPAEGGVAAYLAEIRKFPVLDPEEEYMLAKRWREHHDLEAAHRLVTSHLRLVAKIAWGYRHYGLPLADLISEGNVGLMRAVKKFDPEVGVRLATYAMWWIKAQLHEYLLNSWSMVKIGTMAAQRKLFFNLRRIKARLRIFDNGDLSPEQARTIARELDVGESEVVEMNRRIGVRDASLNLPVGEDGAAQVQDLLVDDVENQETRFAEREELSLRRRLLAEGLKVLDERERHIFTERRLKEEPTTLEELGRHYGVSRERVRQIENKAFEKVQQAVRQSLAAA